MLKELADILEQLHRYFNIRGSLAIETSPNDIDKDVLKKLKSLGFNLLSLGIQSFNNQHLKYIGRDYTSSAALKALKDTVNSNFDTVNIDLIFAIEKQTVDDIKKDLAIALAHQVDQITCYPLFTFPYSEIGEMKKLKKLKLPKLRIRKKMYYAMNDFLIENGYERTNVWSFKKDHTPVYSSVTRDCFLGLGTGAGSYNGNLFYFNTFSVPDYIKTVRSAFPVSLCMHVSKKLEKLFWLYWRLYETSVSKEVYRDKFNTKFELDFGTILKLIRIMGFIEKEDHTMFKLNTTGSHWIHLLQNHYALNYVNKIWSIQKKQPWPDEIKL
jgi:oxygen-independent coproporphyrinogen-3 oxidase